MSFLFKGELVKHEQKANYTDKRTKEEVESHVLTFKGTPRDIQINMRENPNLEVGNEYIVPIGIKPMVGKYGPYNFIFKLSDQDILSN